MADRIPCTPTDSDVAEIIHTTLSFQSAKKMGCSHLAGQGVVVVRRRGEVRYDVWHGSKRLCTCYTPTYVRLPSSDRKAERFFAALDEQVRNEQKCKFQVQVEVYQGEIKRGVVAVFDTEAEANAHLAKIVQLRTARTYSTAQFKFARKLQKDLGTLGPLRGDCSMGFHVAPTKI